MGLLKRFYAGKNEPSQALLRNASSPEGGAFEGVTENGISKTGLNNRVDFLTDSIKMTIDFIV